MKSVYKYPFVDEYGYEVFSCSISLPRGAEILSAIWQKKQVHYSEMNGNAVVYALVDTEEKHEDTYTFRVVGTGHDASHVSGYTFVGTFTISQGDYVFHVFYKKEV